MALLEVKQGDTVYVPGDDYTKNGDKIDWSPAGNEPATGSSLPGQIYGHDTAGAG